MLELISRHIAYPLWDLKDRSNRLAEHRSLLRSQWSSRAQLERLQYERLDAIARYAFEKCRYYREAWGSMPRLSTLDDLRQLPLVRKQDLRQRVDDFISSDYSRSSLVQAKTGGSTGAALDVYFDRECQEARNAAAMRSDSWAGWRAGMLVAALWGTPPVPRTFKERVRALLHDRMFYLDTMRLDEQTMTAFVQEFNARRPGGLFGHAHSLFILARFIENAGLAVHTPKAIIATSMMLLDTEREAIERVFRRQVTNRYGCEEVGLIASQCDRYQGLHVNSEHVIVEILRPDGQPVGENEVGEIVVTDLLNRGMPLLRYAIEDTAVWQPEACDCGRQSPVIARLTGRVADFLVRPDGSLVAGVSLVEKTVTAIDGLDQLQIVQQALDRFVLNVVLSKQADRGHVAAQLERVLRDVFGDAAHIEVRCMDRLPQEANSKYRFAICQVPGYGAGSKQQGGAVPTANIDKE